MKNKGTVTSIPPKSEASHYIGVIRNQKTKIVADSPEFIPEYKTIGAACCDLKANIPPDKDGQRTLYIGHMETVKVDVGFSIAIPPGFEAQIRPRSGFGAKGLIVPNSPGTIDFDFRGRMCVLLTNLSGESRPIHHLDRIAQMALKPVWRFDFEPVDTLDTTERGEGGFGSTGVKT
jgi:dUTP pyrophosphatase